MMNATEDAQAMFVQMTFFCPPQFNAAVLFRASFLNSAPTVSPFFPNKDASS
jgi:hypothetical protein